MEEIKFSDFKIIPDFNSVHREGIDDETYFGDKYKKFISNSRLKWIDPTEGGSPELFQNPPKLQTQSLSIGSAVHQCILEGEEFELAPKINKPTAKLGMVMDNIDLLLHSKKEFDSFDSLIKAAALKVDYYTNTINNKIDFIKNTWYDYSPKLERIRKNSTKKPIILSDTDWETANACIKSLQDNNTIMNILHPTDVFENPFDSFCEDALFIDFIVIYKDKYCSTIPFKLKIDNWTVNTDTRTISLNDLKTTGKSVNKFMEPDGSFQHFHYFRQFSCYCAVLEYYAAKYLGISTKAGWKFEANVCVVETIPNYWSKCFKISEEEIHKGLLEFGELLKRVAYYNIFGFDAKVDFI